MPHKLKQKKPIWFIKEGKKKQIAQKQINLKQTKVAHVEIRLTRRMIVLYPLSWSQRKYNNSDM